MIRNDRAQSVYNYSIFHITLCLANMYAAHSVISAPGGNNHLLLQVLVHGDPKDGITWLSVLVYLATLVILVRRPPVRSSMQAGSG